MRRMYIRSTENGVDLSFVMIDSTWLFSPGVNQPQGFVKGFWLNLGTFLENRIYPKRNKENAKRWRVKGKLSGV